MLSGMVLSFAAQAAVPAPVLMAQPPAPPPAVTQRQAVTPPVPRQPLSSLFTYEDYPAALKGREGRRGVVSLKLIVDPLGRIQTCGIAASSGEAALDMWTCSTLRRRARFTPATDANGAPTGGTVDVTVDWDTIFRRFGKR